MNLNFDNKVWMFIFIIGFFMVLLTSKCLCKSENFNSELLEYGKKRNNYTIIATSIDNAIVYILGDSQKNPLKINNNNIFITIDYKIKNINDIKNNLNNSTILNMFYKNKQEKYSSLLLYSFKKEDVTQKDNVITINNALFTIAKN